MNFPKREIVDKIKKEYPKGTRVELIAMDDPYSKLKPGDKGTVRSVDDTATIHVNWDNHSCLGIVYGEDSCRKLHTVKTICYGEEQVWDKREDAVAFFLQAMAASEGSEQQRYVSIYTKLFEGLDVCSDEE
jgi:hypothetical protein